MSGQLRQAGQLARGFALDDSVGIQHGQNFAYSPEQNTVIVPPDFGGKDKNTCTAILAHEGAHRRISRYHLWDLISLQRFKLGLNALEDPRVNSLVDHEFPVAADQLRQVGVEATISALGTEEVSRLIQFYHGMSREWCLDWEPPPAGTYDEEVEQHLERTRDARMRYANELPTDLEIACHPDLEREYEQEVVPMLSSKDEISSSKEKIIRLSAARAHKIALEEIVDSFHALSNDEDEDEDRSDSGGEGDDEAHRRSLSESIETIEGIDELSPEEEVQATLGILDSSHPRLSVTPQTLAELIEPHLLRKKSRLLRGVPRGTKLDMRQAMAAQADPSLLPKVWMTRERPRNFDAAATLLIDCSGSMAGSKAEAALDGVKLIVGALELLRIPISVLGFQDDVIVILPFDQGYDRAARAALEQIPELVRSRNYEHNDDGPALKEAAEALEKRSEGERLLIVISDGLPAGRHSDEDDLRREIRTIERCGLITLVGVGLGSGTECVKDFYPNAISDVEPDRFPHLLAALLFRLLGGG